MVSGPIPDGPIEALNGDSGPIEYSPLDDMDKPLLIARARFPELDIYRMAWGYLCVPGGTVVFGATDIPGLLSKLIYAAAQKEVDDGR